VDIFLAAISRPACPVSIPQYPGRKPISAFAYP